MFYWVVVVQCLIFGPPGTGKTITLIKTITNIILSSRFSIDSVCAPSNSAADRVTLHLIECGVFIPGDFVRLIDFSSVFTDTVHGRIAPYCVVFNYNTYWSEGSTNMTTKSGLICGK